MAMAFAVGDGWLGGVVFRVPGGVYARKTASIAALFGGGGVGLGVRVGGCQVVRETAAGVGDSGEFCAELRGWAEFGAQFGSGIGLAFGGWEVGLQRKLRPLVNTRGLTAKSVPAKSVPGKIGARWQAVLVSY